MIFMNCTVLVVYTSEPLSQINQSPKRVIYLVNVAVPFVWNT
jgi:hypothetical protein